MNFTPMCRTDVSGFVLKRNAFVLFFLIGNVAIDLLDVDQECRRTNLIPENRRVFGKQLGTENGIAKPRLTVLGAVDDMNAHLGQ